jgi:hypothetical protein
VNDTLTNHSYEEAFKLGLETWALWMERNLNPVTSQVFFRSFAPVHFRCVNLFPRTRLLSQCLCLRLFPEERLFSFLCVIFDKAKDLSD